MLRIYWRGAPTPSLKGHPPPAPMALGFSTQPSHFTKMAPCQAWWLGRWPWGCSSLLSTPRLCHTRGLAGPVTLCFVWKPQLPGYFLRPSYVFYVSLYEVKIFLKPHGWGRWMLKWDPGLSLCFSGSFLKSTGVRKRKVGEGWGSRGTEGTFPLLF